MDTNFVDATFLQKTSTVDFAKYFKNMEDGKN